MSCEDQLSAHLDNFSVLGPLTKIGESVNGTQMLGYGLWV